MSFLKHSSATHSVEGLDAADVGRSRGIAPNRITAELPHVVVVQGDPSVSIDELLLAVATGDRDALATLEERMAGLVRLNILRVLGDASRSDAVTEEFFAEVPQDAVSFDPDQCSGQGWLLTRAHQLALDDASEAPASGRAVS